MLILHKVTVLEPGNKMAKFKAIFPDREIRWRNFERFFFVFFFIPLYFFLFELFEILTLKSKSFNFI